MNLFFFLLAVICAPFYVLFRSYYGSRFFVFMLCAWLVHFALNPTTYYAVKVLEHELQFSGISSWIAVWYGPLEAFIARHGPNQKMFNSPLVFLPLLGAIVWPYHLLTMFIMSTQGKPPGTIGRTLFRIKDSPYNDAKTYALIVGASFAFFVFGEKAMAPLVLFGVVAFIPHMILTTSAGVHGQLNLQGFSLSSLIPSAKTPEAIDPFGKPGETSIATALPITAKSGSLDAVLYQRPKALAALAAPPPR